MAERRGKRSRGTRLAVVKKQGGSPSVQARAKGLLNLKA